MIDRIGVVSGSDRSIAVDGPAGSGKSTAARSVAERTGLKYLDTGAMYRCITLAVLGRGVDPGEASEVEDAVGDISVRVLPGYAEVDGNEVTEEIRSDEVTANVSAVAAHPGVRTVLVRLQREWVTSVGGGVVDGRDIGSVVLPDAAVKVYLEASARERARRRAAETGDDIEQVLESIRRRDHADSERSASPLIVADGAVVIDTTKMTIDQVVDRILRLARKRIADIGNDEQPAV